MNTAEELWQAVINSLAVKLSSAAMDTWFSSCTAESWENDVLTINAPSWFVRRVLEDRFSEIIRFELHKITSRECELTVINSEMDKARLPELMSTYEHPSAYGCFPGDIAPTPGMILNETCKYYNIDRDTIRQKSRARIPSEARKVAMYLMRLHTQCPLNEIGLQFQMRESTVVNSIRTIDALLSQPDSGMREKVRTITEVINNRP